VVVLTERKEYDLTFPLTFEAAFGKEEYVFDDLGNGNLLTDYKHSGHGKSGGDTFINSLLHRCHIMGNQDTVLARRLCEYLRVTSADQSRILHAHDVEIRLAAQQPAKSTIVEIFVSC
jgi:hypothetical protein